MEKQVIDPNDKNEFTVCQSCAKPLVGRALPKTEAEFRVEGLTHYSLLIPVNKDPSSPIASHWKCPWCKFIFPRFGESEGELVEA